MQMHQLGNSNSAINLPAGTYNFTVTDANNCQSTGNATVQSDVLLLVANQRKFHYNHVWSK